MSAVIHKKIKNRSYKMVVEAEEPEEVDAEEPEEA